MLLFEPHREKNEFVYIPSYISFQTEEEEEDYDGEHGVSDSTQLAATG